MHSKTITIVICTHNRKLWLQDTLQSIFTAKCIDQIALKIIIVESGCTDNTPSMIEEFIKNNSASVKISRFSEKKPGRSLALNTAFKNLTGDLIALIDDDHVISNEYLINILKIAEEHPDCAGFCGKIIPMWDGSEPAWVHQKGSTAIRPFPVPNFDLGEKKCLIKETGFIPGAGNLILRRDLIEKVGFFKEDLGPKGHNLSGGEDVEYVLRALKFGYRILYTPDNIQYHQVDKKRLRLSYIIKKSFLRHKVLRKIDNEKLQAPNVFNIPLFLIKQTILNLFVLIIHPQLAHKRCRLVRMAAQLGEIYGYCSNHYAKSTISKN